ncbi:hypothetical protein RFI_09084 [Reticulomyxa filosa]|uniref:Tr-type G domain-containing protein n=1 Tax=Reticulomyxa filosa TaxID=46433 RepID=X6NQS0_RETFI|nr:hypothetical protein RFI_09084 [Reticulomyxa filosa]|eukprot:ETO28049.1 hypothetical protein RFI_09084 [Reticulomyxa filosa]
MLIVVKQGEFGLMFIIDFLTDKSGALNKNKSLSRALSTKFSTASIDKAVESRTRGITLDLGFSCFCVPIPEFMKPRLSPHIKQLQFTLVDCPGHGSLIRTIIGGAQIIDFMILVIDVNKGIQTQTAECLVLGEILTKPTQMIVALNKMDTFEETIKAKLKDSNKKDSHSIDVQQEIHSKLEKKLATLKKVFAKTKFGKNVPMISITANEGGTKKGSNPPGDNPTFDRNPEETSKKARGLDQLIEKLLANLDIPNREEQAKKPFIAAVDHCFNIKGQGTILTTTVLQGTVAMHQVVEIPTHNEVRKVKSLEMFKQKVVCALVLIALSHFSLPKIQYEEGEGGGGTI